MSWQASSALDDPTTELVVEDLPCNAHVSPACAVRPAQASASSPSRYGHAGHYGAGGHYGHSAHQAVAPRARMMGRLSGLLEESSFLGSSSRCQPRRCGCRCPRRRCRRCCRSLRRLLSFPIACVVADRWQQPKVLAVVVASFAGRRARAPSTPYRALPAHVAPPLSLTRGESRGETTFSARVFECLQLCLYGVGTALVCSALRKALTCRERLVTRDVFGCSQAPGFIRGGTACCAGGVMGSGPATHNKHVEAVLKGLQEHSA